MAGYVIPLIHKLKSAKTFLLADEYSKTESHKNRGPGLQTLIMAVISTELKIASDFFQAIADFLGPRYEEGKQTATDYANAAQRTAQQYTEAGKEKLSDLQKKGDGYTREAQKKGEEVSKQAQDKAGEYQKKGEEAKEEVKGQAKEGKEQAKAKANTGK